MEIRELASLAASEAFIGQPMRILGIDDAFEDHSVLPGFVLSPREVFR